MSLGSRLGDDEYDALLPRIPLGTAIPRRIYHTYATSTLPPELAANVERNRAGNPGWSVQLFDDDGIEHFIGEHYDDRIARIYASIDPMYGAARADLFRYLLIYRLGGAYLDVKSGTTRPLDDSIDSDDVYLLSQWDNGAGSARAGWGLHPALRHVPGGELQQWHVIAVAGHPFLRAVIVAVLRRIESYRAWTSGLRQQAVLETTGPIVYTDTIHPLLARYPHRLVRTDDEIGLTYSCVTDFSHKRFFSNHYTRVWRPLIRRGGLGGAADRAFCRLVALRDRLAVATYPLRRRLARRPSAAG